MLDLVIPSRKRERKYRANANRLEAFLRALPFEYCGWNASGVQALSSRFGQLFDLDKIKSIEDIQEVLDPGDAAALDSLYTNLVELGREFDITITAPTTSKVIRLTGQRGSLAAGEEMFNVIWAFDITDYANKINDAVSTLETIELREQEFRSTLDALPMPVWIRDSDLNISWVNKAYSESLKETPATIVADQIELPLTTDENDSRGLKVLAQRALAQQRKQSQTGYILAGGKRTRLEVIMMPADNEGTIGCAINIDRIEDLEKEMRHMQSSNYEVLEQLRTAIAVYDGDTRLEFYNAAFEQLWALDGQWLDKKPKINDIFDKLRENRKIPEQANFVKYKQDWVEKFTSLIEPEENILYLPNETILRMVVVPRPHGGLLITYEDVTSSIALETSYNTLVAVQKETLDNLAEGLAVVGGDGVIKLFNPVFYTLWDLPVPKDHVQEKVDSFFEKAKPLFKSKSWKERKAELVDMCFKHQQTSGRLQLADGRIYSYRSIGLPDGNVLVTFTNVTDTVKVEQALLEKNAALEAAEKLKLDFLANVSYQLRTPLNAMMGFTEILHEEYFGKLNERQKSYTENMIRAGHRLITLVDNILDLSTIEAGYLILNRESIDLKPVMDNVVDLTQDWARREGIEIENKVPNNIGKLMADERRFKQVMLHLIRNAIDYTQSGGLIKVSAKKAKDDIQVVIEDNGIGIPPDDLDRIFIPFEKADGPNDNDKDKKQGNRHSGAGLGLSLVKHIVELHDGRVEIKSTEKKGTKVTCFYPLSANQNT